MPGLGLTRASGTGNIDQSDYRVILKVASALQAEAFQASSSSLDASKLQLPCIVVTGHESSGKSSLLEAISGVRLPTGRGMSTRCPVQLNMVQNVALTRSKYVVKWTPWTAPTAAKKLSTSEELLNEADLKTCLEKAMTDAIDPGSLISSELIQVTVCGPRVPDLTLLDLPGLVDMTGTAGGTNHANNHDLPQELEELVRRHLEGEDKIILCVVEAMLHITSHGKALMLAKEHDPKQERTWVVFTKSDVRDESNPIWKHIKASMEINPKLQYHAVRLRTATEQEASSDTIEVLEKELFEDLAAQQKAAQQKEGNEIPPQFPCPTLVTRLKLRLQDQLKVMLTKHLPTLEHQVGTQIEHLESALSTLTSEEVRSAEAMKIFVKGVGDCGTRIRDLCISHTSTHTDDARMIHPKFKALGEAFQKKILGEGKKLLPDWFFGDECREMVITAMKNRDGQDFFGLVEHPDHAVEVFREEIWSRLDTQEQASSPINVMLEALHQAMEIAIEDILKDEWELAAGRHAQQDKFRLPLSAQKRLKAEISRTILKTCKEEAQQYLDVWRNAQMGTAHNFNKRIELITTLLEEAMYDVQALDKSSPEFAAVYPAQDLAEHSHAQHGKSSTTKGSEARAAAVSILMPILSIFFPIPDLTKPVTFLTEFAYQQLKHLVAKIPRKRAAPTPAHLTDEKRGYAIARVQLAVAAHSLLMLDQWSQQVPAGIKYFMITKVGDIASRLCVHLHIAAWDNSTILNLMEVPSEEDQDRKRIRLEGDLQKWKQHQADIRKLMAGMTSVDLPAVMQPEP